jgi:flagellar motility protein MotE (MotC chaperone)
MSKPPPITAIRPRRGLFGPRLGLPLMALGVAALLPGRFLGPEGLPFPSLAYPSLPGFALLQAAEAPRAAPPGPVALRDGLVATPTISPVLAGPVRPSPLGEERPGEGRLLVEVARRQTELERRERELDLREARILAAEDMTRGQIAALTKLREEMERLVVRESQASEADIDALVALYVNMRPQQAAKVLERLEAPRSAVILLKIPERQAGPILAQMEPPAALAVTQEIAGRRAAFRP